MIRENYLSGKSQVDDFLNKISDGMQRDSLRAWYAFHTIAERKWRHSCVAIPTAGR